MKKSTRIQPDPHSVFIGLDWAKHKHDYCIQASSAHALEFGHVEQDAAKLYQWLEQLSGRFEGRRLSICMEAGRDPVLWRLEDHPSVDLFVVNTSTAARYRKTFTPSGDKNDQRDAASLLDLMQRHPEKIQAHRKVGADARALNALTQARRCAVNRRTSVISSLREVLELYYPVAGKLFDNFSLPIALAFVRRWPDPQSLKTARKSTLTAFFHQHRSRSETLLEKRLELISQSHCVTENPTLLEVGRLQIIDHINQIETLNQSVHSYEQRIDAGFNDHQRASLFNNLPGAAKKLAPRLLSAFLLIDPEDASEMQTMIGVAPIRIQSGQSKQTYMRRNCPKFLRQSFHEFAGCSVKQSAWAKAFYEQQTKTKGCGAHAAKRALAFKWIRILVACWKNNKPYNEFEYIAALQKRKSPLAALITAN